jgi:hypothetical protein
VACGGEGMRDQPDYLSYLVRLWRVSAGGATTWRASVECPHTGEQVGFAGVQDLFDFLSEQTGKGRRTWAGASPDSGGCEWVAGGVADSTEKGGHK